MIIVVAVIGSDSSQYEREFGAENYLDIADLIEMPNQLIEIIGEQLRV